MELVEFIFSDFWHWAGAVLLIVVAGKAIARIALAARGVEEDY